MRQRRRGNQSGKPTSLPRKLALPLAVNFMIQRRVWLSPFLRVPSWGHGVAEWMFTIRGAAGVLQVVPTWGRKPPTMGAHVEASQDVLPPHAQVRGEAAAHVLVATTQPHRQPFRAYSAASGAAASSRGGSILGRR